MSLITACTSLWKRMLTILNLTEIRSQAGIPTEEECLHLECQSATPLLIRKRIGFDFERKPIDFTISKHICDDYEYIVEYA